jgi:hypothetical protein
MNRIEQLKARRRELVAELARLEEVRRGSVVEQFVDAVLKDGRKVRRGPYVLYSFKEKGKTVSRRVRSREEVAMYRRQIEGFRRLRRVMAELVAIGEELSDRGLSVGDEAVKKTPKSRSSRAGR